MLISSDGYKTGAQTRKATSQIRLTCCVLAHVCWIYNKLCTQTYAFIYVYTVYICLRMSYSIYISYKSDLIDNQYWVKWQFARPQIDMRRALVLPPTTFMVNSPNDNDTDNTTPALQPPANDFRPDGVEFGGIGGSGSYGLQANANANVRPRGMGRFTKIIVLEKSVRNEIWCRKNESGCFLCVRVFWSSSSPATVNIATRKKQRKCFQANSQRPKIHNLWGYAFKSVARARKKDSMCECWCVCV